MRNSSKKIVWLAEKFFYLIVRTFLFFLFTFCKSAGESEKKATSEADIYPEQSSKTAATAKAMTESIPIWSI